MDFLGDNLGFDKAHPLQRSLLIPANHIALMLRSRRIQANRRNESRCKYHKSRCKYHKSRCKYQNSTCININCVAGCHKHRVYFLLLLLHPVQSCKKSEHLTQGRPWVPKQMIFFAENLQKTFLKSEATARFLQSRFFSSANLADAYFRYAHTHICYYRTQVSLWSNLWVLMSVRPSVRQDYLET